MVTLLGIVTEVNRLFEKATPPIVVTLLGIITEVSRLFENAPLPIVVTLFGIVTEVSWFSEKAKSPIVVTGYPSMEEGITTFPVLVDERMVAEFTPLIELIA